CARAAEVARLRVGGGEDAARLPRARAGLDQDADAGGVGGDRRDGPPHEWLLVGCAQGVGSSTRGDQQGQEREGEEAEAGVLLVAHRGNAAACRGRRQSTSRGSGSRRAAGERRTDRATRPFSRGRGFSTWPPAVGRKLSAPSPALLQP